MSIFLRIPAQFLSSGPIRHEFPNELPTGAYHLGVKKQVHQKFRRRKKQTKTEKKKRIIARVPATQGKKNCTPRLVEGISHAPVILYCSFMILGSIAGVLL
eukprot:m.176602 g.176602  ORF g.176602 m.176602 type:complete len:101 (-) comp15446_c0_seq6:505-807(-)